MSIIEISLLTAKIILGVALAIVALIAIGFTIFIIINFFVEAFEEIKEKINKNKTNEND